MEQDLRQILAANARRLKEFHKTTEAKIAAAGRVGTGSVNRVLSGQNVTFDVLSGIAKGLGMQAWQLLVPDLDPSNPPIVMARSDMKAEVARQVAMKWAEVQKTLDDLRVKDEKAGRPSVADPYADSEAQKQRAAALAAANKAGPSET